MKRLLISSASLVLALSFAPAYGASHGHDEGMEKEGAGMEMEEHKDHGMEGGTHEGTNLEELPPTSAGQPEEEGMEKEGMDGQMHDDSGMSDKMDTMNLEEKKSSSEY